MMVGAELSLAGKSILPVVLCTKTLLTLGELLIYVLLSFNYRKSDECHELDTSEVRTTVKYECINNMCISNGKLERLDSNKHGDKLEQRS